ncbi:MAG: hypothetical protein GY930_16755 [bacterium]|nr:hypothetical protein [bacterium]
MKPDERDRPKKESLPWKDLGSAAEPGVCIKSGNPSAQRVLFSKNY